MPNNISAISLFIALVGVSLNAIFTRPYVGDCYLGDEEKPRSSKEKLGKIANGLIVLGTIGQLIALLVILKIF